MGSIAGPFGDFDRLFPSEEDQLKVILKHKEEKQRREAAVLTYEAHVHRFLELLMITGTIPDKADLLRLSDAAESAGDGSTVLLVELLNNTVPIRNLKIFGWFEFYFPNRALSDYALLDLLKEHLERRLRRLSAVDALLDLLHFRHFGAGHRPRAW
jgi:hypothetical protein